MASLGILVLLGHFSLNAQEHPDFEKWKAKYPEEQIITLKKKRDIEILEDQNGLSIKINHFENIYYLGSAATKYAKEQVYSSEFIKTENIKAYTKIPTKKKYKQIDVTEFKDSFDKNSSSFYDDTKVTNFTFPSVEKGVQTVLEYEQKVTDPHFTGLLFFESYMPSEEVAYSIKVPENVKLNYRTFNDPEKRIKVSKEAAKGYTIYTFSMNQIPSFKYESDMPRWNYLTPHVSYQIDSYTNAKGENIDVLSSVGALYKWYYTFLERIGEEDQSAMSEIVSGIISDSDSELEKAKKIFYWVQHNIKYIAFEDGMRGFIPHTGSYVCEKKYGDCKDMASTIVSLFKAAGLNANYTWVGTRDLPYTYHDLPSPSVDNHMIATYQNNGRTYFLDATSQYSPFDMPSSMIQGKEVLISKSREKFEVITVPVIERNKNQAVDSIWLKVDSKNTLKGRGSVRFSGFQKVFNTYYFTDINEQEVLNTLDAKLEKGSNKFTLIDYKIHNIEDHEKPLAVDYNFELPDYISAIGEELYINLNLEKSFSGAVLKEERKLPLENEFKYENSNYSVLELPQGYRIQEIPENVKYENEVFGFEIIYEVIENTIVRRESYFVDYLLLYPEKFDTWNEGVKKITDAFNQIIVLEKIK